MSFGNLWFMRECGVGFKVIDIHLCAFDVWGNRVQIRDFAIKTRIFADDDFKHQDAKAVNIGFFWVSLSRWFPSESDVYNFDILVQVVNLLKNVVPLLPEEALSANARTI